MKRTEYLRALNRALRRAGIADRRKTLDYYEEIINDGREQGLSEAEAVARLDAPEEVARILCLESPTPSRRRRSAMEWLLLCLGMPFLLVLAVTLLSLLIALLAALLSVLIAADAVELSLIVAGIGSLGMCVFTGISQTASLLFVIGASLVLEGLALLLLKPVLNLNAIMFRVLSSLTEKTCAALKRMITERRY